MAWLEQQNSGVFVVCFRYGGARLKRSTKTRSAEKAERMWLRIEENIELVERGRLEQQVRSRERASPLAWLGFPLTERL